MLDEIVVKKAAQHNLKQIDVRLPRNRLIVVTGPSGSGKSSLAFDTLFAEGQRRYIECMSAYARQYMEMMEKPEVESIEGISPAISIDQKTISANPRSTVGTVTEIYDFLRLLFARVGVPHCPSCGRPVSQQTAEQIVGPDHRPPRPRPGSRSSPRSSRAARANTTSLFDRLLKKGFVRIRVDGRFRDLDGPIVLEKTRKHSAEVLIDEIRVAPHSEKRVREAVARALDIAEGEVLLVGEDGRESYYSLKLLCPVCDISLPELEPRSFSFNSPYGACPRCNGLGYRIVTDEWGEVELTEDLCAACHGSRLKPESLAVRDRRKVDLGARAGSPSTAWPGSSRNSPSRAAQELVASKIRKEILTRLAVMAELGLSYLHLNRTTGVALGRRGPARPARGPGRRPPPRHPLRPRRADDRPPPARQRPAHRPPPPDPGRREFGPRRRARRADDPGRRLHPRPRPGSRRAGRPRRRRRARPPRSSLRPIP